MLMMKTSHTFYTTDSRHFFMDSRQVFIQQIGDKHIFMVDVSVFSITSLMTLTCVLFVIVFSYLVQVSVKSKDWQRLFVTIFSVLLFLEDNQRLNIFYDMTLLLFKILKEGMVVQWLASRGFDLKVGALLRHKSILHVVSLNPAVY